MKKAILLFIVFYSLSAFAQEDITTYYLIRHAEKNRTDKTNKNPHLSEKGIKRAKRWSKILQRVNFDMIYSTNYLRTIETAKPIATSNSLKIKIYKPKNIYNKNFKEITKGKNVLIVGHSNTTPYFANKILGKEKYKKISDKYNGNLYIITVTKNKIIDILLKFD